MSRMLKPAPMIALLASSLFALDEYLPVPFRVMQIQVGAERTSITGDYDVHSENDEIPSPDDPLSLPIQGKFGVVENLEGSMAIDYIIQDRHGKTGLNRPLLGLKYADPGRGWGGFLGASLPVGFDEIMNAGNYATLTFGALYGKKFPHLNLLANLSYSYNTEDDTKSKVDNLRLFVKPEYQVPGQWFARKKQYLGVNVALAYEFDFNHITDGESTSGSGFLVVAAPGLYYTINRIVSLEVSAPMTLAGQSAAYGFGVPTSIRNPASNGVRALLFFSLEEGLYNAL